jgi:YidC/Oxa1 family membrane protein insertase
MDKKSLIGLGLIAVILITWLAMSGPTKEQIARNKQIKDSIEFAAKAQEEELKLAAEAIAAVQPRDTVVLSDSAIIAMKSSVYRDFTPATQGKNEDFIIENNLMKVYISSKGAKVHKVELKNYNRYGKKEPLILFEDSVQQEIVFNAYDSKQEFSTDSFYFAASPISSKGGSQILSLRLNTSNPNSFIEYVYTMKDDNYMLDYDVNFVGLNSIIPSTTKVLKLKTSQALPSQEQHITKERETATAYFKESVEGVDYINARKSEKYDFSESNIKWVTFKQHFFNTTFIAKSEFLKEGSFIQTSENPNSEFVKTITSELSIPYNHKPNESFGMQVYFGPNHFNTLKTYNLDLEDIIPTGWSVFSYINKWMVIPLLNSLSSINAGIIILILTLILKTLLLPIAYKTYMSSAKMRVLKPEIDELNAKFEKNDDPMKKQQETMALYRRA